ncbi:MAG: HAMP domain-containing histidine kinase [Chrysiogenetes bacterium]|nr:HAMP domain-containing histidine kinase [Chrysiogenetes bacterium]
MKIVDIPKVGHETSDLFIRAVLSAGFALAALSLGARSWPVWGAIGYFALVVLQLAVRGRINLEAQSLMRYFQVAADALVITAIVQMTGASTTVAAAGYPLLVLGVSMDWGVKFGRASAICSGVFYAALLGLNFTDILPYDPYIRSASHLDFILTHNVIFQNGPRWAPFATAGAGVIGVIFASFMAGKTLVEQRERVQQQLVDMASRNAVAEVITGVAGSLLNPLNDARSVVDSAAKEIRQIRDHAGINTRYAESDLELAGQIIGRSAEMLRHLGELVHLPADFRDALDMNDLIRLAKQELVGEYGSRVFSIKEHKARALPPVRGDVTLLYRCVVQLLERGLRSLPIGAGQIDVTTFEHGGRVVMVFADQGPGYSERELAELLDPGTAGYMSKSDGSLGLALVREVVRFHQGQLDIQSQPGEGTRVRIELPIAAA